jgi:hypothetical protein
MSQAASAVVAPEGTSTRRPIPRASSQNRTIMWLTVLPLIALVCFLDGHYVAAHFAYGQWLANVIMVIAFVWLYRAAPTRLRALMKYGVFIAAAGEALFSLVFGMYEYRLHSIPLYVPPGHSIMYAAVYYFVREPWVFKNRRMVSALMLVTSVAYAAYWLVTHNDVYGALCTLFFVVLIARNAESRLFFLSMFLFVAYLELVGTGAGAWFWWPTAFDKFAFLPSGNPPSGISVFYFGFDGLCLAALLRRRPELRMRLRRLRSSRERSSAQPGQLAQV